MSKLKKARTAAVVFAILFYIFAKVGCLGTAIDFGGYNSLLGTIICPVSVSIIYTFTKAYIWIQDMAAFYAICLAVQISGLGLSAISVLLVYAFTALYKAEHIQE